MEVFRITHAKWANKLVASGFPARWNSRGIETIYSAATRSLACLENIVHRNKSGLTKQFRTVVIYIPDRMKREIISVQDLPERWFGTSDKAFHYCRNIGDNWAIQNTSPVLFVPSAIIKNEFNVLLNVHHPDFKEIRIVDVEPFMFDPGIKT